MNKPLTNRYRRRHNGQQTLKISCDKCRVRGACRHFYYILTKLIGKIAFPALHFSRTFWKSMPARPEARCDVSPIREVAAVAYLACASRLARSAQPMRRSEATPRPARPGWWHDRPPTATQRAPVARIRTCPCRKDNRCRAARARRRPRQRETRAAAARA